MAHRNGDLTFSPPKGLSRTNPMAAFFPPMFQRAQSDRTVARLYGRRPQPGGGGGAWTTNRRRAEVCSMAVNFRHRLPGILEELSVRCVSF